MVKTKNMEKVCLSNRYRPKDSKDPRESKDPKDSKDSTDPKDSKKGMKLTCCEKNNMEKLCFSNRYSYVPNNRTCTLIYFWEKIHPVCSYSRPILWISRVKLSFLISIASIVA